MKLDDIYKNFIKIFPVYEDFVKEYKRFGSRMIYITFNNDLPPLYFLYTNDNDWNLGTKPHRQHPNANYSEGKEKGNKEKN